MSKRKPISILQAMQDPDVFGFAFQPSRIGAAMVDTWRPWRAFLASLFGIPLSPWSLRKFRKQTKQAGPRRKGYDAAWMVCGRRAGKSSILALIAAYLATFRDYREHLAPGEVATIMIVAADRKQAQTILSFAKGLLLNSPICKRSVTRVTADGIELKNRVRIEVHTCSFRSVRGYTAAAVLFDEVAFWRSEETYANPDTEILAAVEPAMATIPGAVLVGASSPHARKGLLWEKYRKHFTQEGSDELVWQASTREMNRRVRKATVRRALERDPAKNSAEYLAQFRDDIEDFVSLEAVEACVVPGRFEMAPEPGLTYRAFVDPSGGRSDSFTLAIGYRHNGRPVLACLRERFAPFSPDEVVREYARVLKSYGISKVNGDRYAGAWPEQAFAKHGINYTQAARPKSDLYGDLLPLINSQGTELLQSKRLISQLVGLERSTRKGARDSIDHPRGMHDDLANAAAGVLTDLSGGSLYTEALGKAVGNVDDSRRERKRWRFQSAMAERMH